MGSLRVQPTGRGQLVTTLCVSRALATPCDCRGEHSEWDKLFIMLENSQMREGMLLQATDDVLRGELQRLRVELGRLAGGMARPCAAGGPADARLARALEPLLQESRDASRRLARLEDAETRRSEASVPGLGAVLEELQRTRADLSVVQSWAARRWLPAGKHRAQCPPNALSLEPAAFNHTRRFSGDPHPRRPGNFHMHAHRAQTHHTRQTHCL